MPCIGSSLAVYPFLDLLLTVHNPTKLYKAFIIVNAYFFKFFCFLHDVCFIEILMLDFQPFLLILVLVHGMVIIVSDMT